MVKMGSVPISLGKVWFVLTHTVARVWWLGVIYFGVGILIHVTHHKQKLVFWDFLIWVALFSFFVYCILKHHPGKNHAS